MVLAVLGYLIWISRYFQAFHVPISFPSPLTPGDLKQLELVYDTHLQKMVDFK